MKPIETNEMPELPYGKILFLVAIILIAVVVAAMPRKETPVGAEKKVETEEQEKKDNKTEEKDTKRTVSEQETGSEEESADEAKKDINYQEEIVKEVKKTYDSVAKDAEDKTQEVTDDVLGVAQEKVEETASRSANTIKNTVYKSTIGHLILQLIASMPEEAWEEMKPEVCAPQETEVRRQNSEEESGEGSRDALHASPENTKDDEGNEEKDDLKPAEDDDESSRSFEDYDACFQEKIKGAEGPDDYQKAMEECKEES